MELKDILNLEKSIQDMIDQIADDIRRDIHNDPLDGVTPLGSGCFSVKLSTVRNKGFVLAPEYYSSETQARVVADYLSGSKTATTLIERFDRMLSDKKVKESGNNVTHLNDKTLEILQRYRDGVK